MVQVGSACCCDAITGRMHSQWVLKTQTLSCGWRCWATGIIRKCALVVGQWIQFGDLPSVRCSIKTYLLNPLNLHSVHVRFWLLALNFTSKHAHVRKHIVWEKRLLHSIICNVQLCDHVLCVILGKFLDYARCSKLFHSFVVNSPRRTTMFWLHLQSVWVIIEWCFTCLSRRSHGAISSHAAMEKDLRSAV